MQCKSWTKFLSLKSTNINCKDTEKFSSEAQRSPFGLQYSKQIKTITLKRYDKYLHLHLFVGGAGAWLAYPTKHQHLSPFNKICYITSEVKDN
jgi:hypothetical protein